MPSDVFAVTGNGGAPYLVKELMIDDTLRIGARVSVLRLFEHERDLCTGRFEHFTREPQVWPASIRFRLQGENKYERNEQMVNWIAEQTDTPWSLDVEDELDDEGMPTEFGRLRFSFTDSTVGVMFKMVFA
jgi:hypothetical protein